jgi:hypothetical protein
VLELFFTTSLVDFLSSALVELEAFFTSGFLAAAFFGGVRLLSLRSRLSDTFLEDAGFSAFSGAFFEELLTFFVATFSTGFFSTFFSTFLLSAAGAFFLGFTSSSSRLAAFRGGGDRDREGDGGGAFFRFGGGAGDTL